MRYVAKWHALRQFVRFKYDQRFRGFDVSEEPHFDPLSLPEFKRLLSEARCYLEYGSGGSTLLAAKLKVPTITVDSDPFFARAVSARLDPAAGHRMLLADVGITGKWGYPVFTRPTPSRVRRWSEYVRLPFRHLDGLFPDLILVDGRFRRACALESARQAQIRAAETTIFVDDYLGRRYASIEAHLGVPRMAGRAAIFAVDRSLPPIPVAAIEDALRDVA